LGLYINQRFTPRILAALAEEAAPPGVQQQR
jgi:hypothetical protein